MKFLVVFLVSFACFVAVFADEPRVEVSKEKGCEPGQEFTVDCSVCKCNSDGTEASCEKRECPPIPTEKPDGTVAPLKENECKPGELFKIACNECKCPESGIKTQAACTVTACPDSKGKP